MKQTVKTSRAAGQLEKMFRELNKHYFAGKLPEPIISLKKTPSAYGHITCSKVWQAGGENKYEINISSATLDRPIEETASTLLHEMTHSTMTPERLNREMGGRFGDPKYAKEELVAELTAAMISHSMGFDSKVTDNSAAYLDSWIGALRKEPKFIVSVMADVNKASDLILDHVDRQRLALGEQPYLAKNDPFTPLDAEEEVPFKNAAIVKTRSGDYAIRASYDGVELGLKKVSKDTAKTYFQLTDLKDKTAFLTMTAHKTYEPELAVMRRTQKTSVGLGL